MTTLSTPRLLALFACALAGCTAATAPPSTLRPEVMVPPPNPPSPGVQTFAATELEGFFADPERRKKLESAFPTIDALAEEQLRSQKQPGLVIGVVIDGELAYAKGFGVTDLEKKSRPDPDTIYRLGSITKSFTGLAVLSLRDAGALSLDDRLTRLLPEAEGLVYPTHDSAPITLRQLLTHTSGLPPRNGDVNLLRTDRDFTEDELLKTLVSLPLARAPGEAFEYSNLGFALLGVAAGRAAHTTFREVVDKQILAPLGMTSTFWDRASAPADRLATAYTRDPRKPQGLRAVEHVRFGALGPAGGLYSSLRDMARYVGFQLSAYPARSAPRGWTGPTEHRA